MGVRCVGPVACVMLLGGGCDLGGLDLGGASGPGLSANYEGRRISVGLDTEFELCPGNLAQWSAQLDRIDNTLLLDTEGSTSLYFFEDEEALVEACDGQAGCYVARPEGPQSNQPFDLLDGRTVPWFVDDRLEYGWSVSLPPFVVVGMRAALTGRSCTKGSSSLSSVLNRGSALDFTQYEANATGQWFRLLLQQAGPERLYDFASKLDEGSNEDFVRAVFAEVYGVPIDLTWDEAADTPLLAPPAGWCEAPPLPLIEGRAEWSEPLDCSGPRTLHRFEDVYGAAVRLDVGVDSELTVSGQLPQGAQLELWRCDCEGAPWPGPLILDEPRMLESGSWELRVQHEGGTDQRFELELSLAASG